MPGAIGILCSSADARKGGDSRAFDRPFQALPPPLSKHSLYFEGADLSAPLASPILYPEIMKQFPPTLLLTGIRAGEVSAAISTHRALVKEGVETELHLWDGLGHAFFYDPGFPESSEAFETMTAFFAKHLSLSTQ